MPSTPTPTKIEWRVDPEDGQLKPYLGNEPVTWAPQPGSQEMFLNCPVRECLYHGSRGPGKTDALVMDYLQDVGKGWGTDWVGVLFRRTVPELQDVIRKSKKWFPRIFPRAQYNKSERVWTFPDGEMLKFGYLDSENDYESYHGWEISWLAFEEITLWPNPDVIQMMMSLNRCSNARVRQRMRIRATCNPSGCVPYGDVLTTRGWVPIQEVTIEDHVVSVTSTGETVNRPVSQVHEYDFDGELISRKGNGLSMVFTPEHRFPHFNTNRSEHTVKAFTDLPGEAILRRTGEKENSISSITTVTPPVKRARRKLRGARVENLLLMDYAELLGWYLAEGCCCERDSAVCIAQQKPQNVEKIRSLLERCGFHYRYDGKIFWISEPYWMDHFSVLGKSREKHVPRWFLDCGIDALEICLKSMMLGDGSGDHTYHTISKQLRDDVAEIATRLGRTVFIYERQRENRVGLSYEVRMSSRSATVLHTGNHRYNVSTTSKSINCEKIFFTGKVYCLSVPETETFYIRQNGCVWLSGNSGHTWVKHRYQLPNKTGHPNIGTLIKTPGQHDRISIQGHLTENKVLLNAQPDYIEQIRAAAPDEATLRAWEFGDWDIVAGGMFTDVWSSDHNVVPAFRPADMPLGWILDRSYDHGQSRPFSVGWWAVSNGEPLILSNGKKIGAVPGDLIRFAEWYGWTGKPNEGIRMASEEIAKEILEREKRWEIYGRVRRGIADASIFDQYEPGKSVAGNMMRMGVTWAPSDKSKGSRKHGWEEMRKWMKNAKPPKGGYRETPGLFVTVDCDQFLRTVPVLDRDKKNPDDVNTDSEDHIADEVRYRVRAKIGNTVTVMKG